MNGYVNTGMASVSEIGRAFWGHAANMFVQSSVLIVVLLLADRLLRPRLRATLRYWIWMLVIIKLLLPPTLSLPTGIGYWCGAPVRWFSATLWQIAAMIVPQPAGAPAVAPIEAAMPPIVPSDFDLNLTAAGPGESACAPYGLLTGEAIVLLLWGVGVLVLSGWMVQRLLVVRKLLARGQPVESDLLDLLEQCRRRMGVRRKVGLKQSSGTFSPAVCGLWRPTILVPTVLLERLSPDQLKSILIHELAHIQRGDLWVNCLQTALQIVYFYNPLVWLANAIVRRVREQAVDEMSLVALGAEAGSYGYTLIDVAEMAFRRASPALGLVGVAESKKSLEGRIRHMVTRPIPKSARVGMAGVFAVATLGAVMLPMAAAQTRLSPAESITRQDAPELPRGIAALFGLSKDDLLAKYGQPDAIFYGQNRYTLDNLPQRYFMVFQKAGLSFSLEAGRVTGVTLLSPDYVFGNGVRVGDSEARVKEAFGPNYVVKESQIKDFLIYEQLDLSFEVYKPDRIVREINIGPGYGRVGRAGPKATRGRVGVPMLPAGIAELFELSKEDVLARFGQPEAIFYGEHRYTLDSLPPQYYMAYRDPQLSFHIRANRVVEVTLLGPAYVFSNGIRVGDSEAKVKQAFGPDYVVKESQIKDFLIYEQLDLSFEVYKPDRIVREINIGPSYGKADRAGQKATAGRSDAPGLPQGIAALFGLSKDDLLAKYGRPDYIFYGEDRYRLDNLPRQYYLGFNAPRLSFRILDNRVVEVTLLGPAYVFSNGVRVGDSEAKVKKAFGPNYVVKESPIKDFLIYPQWDVSFEVYKPDRIVREINIGRDYGRSDQSEQQRGEGQRADRVNLSAIGKACLLYADAHDDRLPPDLQTLVKEENLSPASLESKRKPEDFPGPSYIYISGQTMKMYPGNFVAYENPEFCADGVNVLHLDTHVEFMKPDAFRRELKETYERLGKPMPEVKFKDGA